MGISHFLSQLLVRFGAYRQVPGLHERVDGGAATLRYWSSHLRDAPVNVLKQAEEFLSSPSDPDTVDLSAGSPTVPPPPVPRIPPDQCGWPVPGGLPELRGAIARHLAAPGVEWNPAENVLVTGGGLAAVHTAFDAFLDRRDAVVLPDPISPIYPLALQSRRASIRWVPARNEDGHLKLRIDKLSSALRGAKLLVLCSPCNPTGGCHSPEDLEQIAWWAEKRQALILSDESFAQLCHDGPHEATTVFAPGRTITIGSMSKVYGLAWARVGWLAGPKHLIRACSTVAALRDPFVPWTSQMAAIAALGKGSTEANRQLIESRRGYVLDRLRAAGLEAIHPSAGFFVWVTVPKNHGSGTAFARSLLQSCKVRVVPGEIFGPSGIRNVRISFAGNENRLEEGLNRLAGFVRQVRIAPSLAAA